MKKQEKYCVIGGQYFPVHDGNAATLEEAKTLAGKNREYWDNWQGWHVPSVFRLEDVEKIHHYFAGSTLAPKENANPVAFAWCEGGSGKIHWENF